MADRGTSSWANCDPTSPRTNTNTTQFGIDAQGFYTEEENSKSPGNWHSGPKREENVGGFTDRWPDVKSHLNMAMNSSNNGDMIHFAHTAGIDIKADFLDAKGVISSAP